MFVLQEVMQKERKHTAVCESQSVFMLIKIFKLLKKTTRNLQKQSEEALILLKWNGVKKL